MKRLVLMIAASAWLVACGDDKGTAGSGGAAGSSGGGGAGASGTGGAGASGTGGAGASGGTGGAGASGAGSGGAGSGGAGSGGAGSGGAGSGGAGGRAGSGGTGGTGGMGVVCNMLTADGMAITVNAASGAAPAATGGMVMDGTFHLTKATLYGSGLGDGPVPGAPTVKSTLQVMGNHSELVQVPTGMPEVRNSATFTVMGTSLATTNTCPDMEANTVPFSVMGNRLELQFPVMLGPIMGTAVLEYTRQ